MLIPSSHVQVIMELSEIKGTPVNDTLEVTVWKCTCMCTHILTHILKNFLQCDSSKSKYFHFVKLRKIVMRFGHFLKNML